MYTLNTSVGITARAVRFKALVSTASSSLSLVGQWRPQPEWVTEASVRPAVLWHMERLRRWPCQPTSLPVSQLAKTEGVFFCCLDMKQTKAGLRSSLVVRLQPCRRTQRDSEICMNKVVGRRETDRKQRVRELVEARCPPQSRPGCLVARSNQTWCHRQLNLDLMGGFGRGGHFPLPRISLGAPAIERERQRETEAG